MEHLDSEPLRIPGEILSEAELAAIATPTEDDINALPEQWGRIVPPRYKRLISAEGTNAS